MVFSAVEYDLRQERIACEERRTRTFTFSLSDRHSARLIVVAERLGLTP
jgi:hypothetical protein